MVSSFFLPPGMNTLTAQHVGSTAKDVSILILLYARRGLQEFNTKMAHFPYSGFISDCAKQVAQNYYNIFVANGFIPRHVRLSKPRGVCMREQLANLRAALQDLKRASVFRKAIAAETALISAVALIEQMMEEIENLKREKDGAETKDV
jgi:hypothetical protein